MSSRSVVVQAQSLLRSFNDLIAGKHSNLSADPPDGSRAMVYRVPPSEFLKVLLEGDATCLPALHAALQVRILFYIPGTSCC